MDRQYNDEKKKDKMTMIYKTLHRKLKIITNLTNNRGELRTYCELAKMKHTVYNHLKWF